MSIWKFIVKENKSGVLGMAELHSYHVMDGFSQILLIMTNFLMISLIDSNLCSRVCHSSWLRTDETMRYLHLLVIATRPPYIACAISPQVQDLAFSGQGFYYMTSITSSTSVYSRERLYVRLSLYLRASLYLYLYLAIPGLHQLPRSS